MPHITLSPDLPGIRGPMAFRPETARPLNELVDVLLRGPHTLSPGERELIATYVSSQNDCEYCQTIHGAIAAHHLKNEPLVIDVKRDYQSAAISPKLKALLATPEIHAQLNQNGMLPRDNPSVEWLQDFVKSEIARWGKVVQQAGIAGTQ